MDKKNVLLQPITTGNDKYEKKKNTFSLSTPLPMPSHIDCPEPPVQEVLLRKYHILPSVGDAHNAPLPGTCCSSLFLSD